MAVSHDVKVGEFVVAKSPDILKAILGSCIGFIVYDKIHKIGGLVHIFLPERRNDEDSNDAKYANTAVPLLINEVIKQGAKKAALVGYMVGGGRILRNPKFNELPSVAEKNIIATKEAIMKSGIILLNCNVGMDNGIKVWFNLETGDLKVEHLPKLPT
mgnify:CR=1 FL=1